MISKPSFKRNPAVRCWLKHIEESSFNENDNNFHTIFGAVRRIRIIATIIEKKEKLIEVDEDYIGLGEHKDGNTRLTFHLDDGTGTIKAVVDDIDPEKYGKYKKGDIVDIVGRISKRGESITLWIEIIKNVEEPNQILLRNAEIMNRIKSGDIQRIPDFSEVSDKTGEMSKEIDVNKLFEDDLESIEVNEIKEKVFSTIESYTNEGRGIDFAHLKEKINIPDIELRTYLNDLLLESRIYESDNDNYESF
ncbi:MAG: OB-fold nucleic acid binding domain-containing protein [Promethearchaeota archaeon]